MIRHLVLVRFRKDVDEAEVSSTFARLGALQTLVPGMTAFVGGANVSPECLARGFTHAFSCDFETPSARDAYLVHPAHKDAAGRLLGMLEGGVDGVLVLDVEHNA